MTVVLVFQAGAPSLEMKERYIMSIWETVDHIHGKTDHLVMPVEVYTSHVVHVDKLYVRLKLGFRGMEAGQEFNFVTPSEGIVFSANFNGVDHKFQDLVNAIRAVVEAGYKNVQAFTLAKILLHLSSHSSFASLTKR